MNGSIVFRDVSFSYPDKKVLEHISFEIAPSSRVFLAGPSGSGKTTLLRLLASLERPTNGEITLPDQHRVSFVFQEDRLLPDLSAVRNIAFTAGKAFDRSILDRLGIEREDRERPVRDFSGGMKRRIAIARAIAVPFDILLLDEPLTGLDEKRRHDAAREIMHAAEGKILVLTSHLPEDKELFRTDRSISV